MSKRFCPEIPLPPYAFIPGKNPHPEKTGGHMEGHKIEVSPLTSSNYTTNSGYLYGIDLFNEGYYWESHVWWEALWNKANRVGDTADFLKGLIKISAAGVKEKLNQESASQGHLDRAIEILLPLSSKRNNWFGIDLKELIQKLEVTKATDIVFTLT